MILGTPNHFYLQGDGPQHSLHPTSWMHAELCHVMGAPKEGRYRDP